MSIHPHDTLSIILPYYNRADTLEEAASSVLDQTYRNLILYLINDGSIDASRYVARRLRDARIVHIDLDGNRGASHARNIGLAEASTPLVAFMDSDDVWLPHKAEVQIQYLRDAQATDPRLSVAGCGWRLLSADARSKEFARGPFSRLDVLHNRVAGMGTPMLLVDRSVAARDSSFDESIPALEEGDYVMSCLSNGSMLVIVPEILVLVRRGRADHLATATRTAAGWEAFIDKYSAELESYPKLKAWYAYRAARDHLVSRNIPGAIRHFPIALRDQCILRSLQFLLGTVGGRGGLAIARRVLAPRRRAHPSSW